MRSLFKEKILKSPVLDKNRFFVDKPPLPEFKPFFSEIEEIEHSHTSDDDSPAEVEENASIIDEEVAAVSQADYTIEAQEIIATARQEANELLTATQAELEALKAETEKNCREALEEARKQGYEAGLEQGNAEGREKAETEHAAKMEEAQTIRQEACAHLEQAKADGELIRKSAEEERTRRILESEEEILKLAIDIAERIIRKEISQSGVNWFEMVKEAVKKVAGATEVTIRVSAEDEAYLIQHLSEVQKLLTESPSIRVISDAALEPGDVVIQSNLGQLDARIKEQLASMLKSLREEAIGNE